MDKFINYKKILQGGLAALSIAQATPTVAKERTNTANRFPTTIESHAAERQKTSTFRIGLPDRKITQKKFDKNKEIVDFTATSAQINEKLIPENETPTGYLDICSRVQAFAEKLCQKIENPKPNEMKFNFENFRKLQAINNFVNTYKFGVDDLELFNKSEYWDTNIYRDKGDCEDITRMKYSLLLQNGFQAESLSPTLAWNGNEGHLVLAVNLVTDDGRMVTFILDNLKARNNPEGDILILGNVFHLKIVAGLKHDRSGWGIIKIKDHFNFK